MIIYSFLRSNDIAEHCEKIGHKFDALNMAAIVWNSHKPLKEKLLALKWIIENEPDMSSHDTHWFNAQESVHQYIKRLIERAKSEQKKLMTPKSNEVYYYYIPKNRPNNNYCFSTFQKALDSINGNCGWDEDGINLVYVYKTEIDAEWHSSRAEVNKDGEIVNIDLNYDFNSKKDIGALFPDIPMPFQKGDIVEVEGEPCVLTHLPHFRSDYETYKLQADATDFGGMYLYFCEGKLECGHREFNDLHDLKFYRGKFEGKQKLLVSLSGFWKNHANLSMYEFSEILRYYRALEFLEIKDTNFREYEYCFDWDSEAPKEQWRFEETDKPMSYEEYIADMKRRGFRT